MIKIPLAKPYFNQKEERAVIKVLRSGWHTQGPKVVEFEQQLAKYVDSKYAIAVSNCTTALHLALVIGGIKPCDEVITPSYTFIATANSIIHAGAKPIFVDVDPRTFNIDANKIEEKITKKTKAILFVDQVGLPSDINSLKTIAKKHHLLLIEDAACAIGAKYKNKMVGSLADITCFSFHPRKLISSGEGGIITTNNKDYAEKANIYRSHGMSMSDLKRHLSNKVNFEEYNIIGYNYRMTDLQAAICIEQINKIQTILSKRKIIAERYNKFLEKIPYLEIPFVPDYATHNWQSYIIKVKDNSPISRNELMNKLLEKGIATRKGVMACHMEPVYKKIYKTIKLPNTEKLIENSICLPIYPQMTIEEQDYVISAMINILK